MKIAITGCVACGKTTFSNFLSKYTGFELISADTIVSNLYKKQSIIKQLQEMFPSVFYRNTLIKDKLRSLILEDTKARKTLESFIHPIVIKNIKNYIHTKQNIIAEIPLLFEVGMENNFDLIITLRVSEDILVSRLKERGLSKIEAKKLIQSQMDIDKKAQKSHIVVESKGSLSDLENHAKIIAEKIKATSKASD